MQGNKQSEDNIKKVTDKSDEGFNRPGHVIHDLPPASYKNPIRNEWIEKLERGESVHWSLGGITQTPSPVKISIISWKNMLERNDASDDSEAQKKNNGANNDLVTKLANTNNISNNFYNLIGLENVRNITGLEGKKSQIDIFAGIVEKIATRDFHEKFPSMSLFFPCDGNGYSKFIPARVNEDGIVTVDNNDFMGGWIDLLTRLYNLPRLDAIATLANQIGLDFNKLFIYSDCRHAAETMGNIPLSLDYNEVPKRINLPNLPTQKSIAQLIDLIRILGAAGQLIGAIALYKWDDEYFCLAATVGNQKLSLGRYKTPSYWLNQHLLDKYPAATVIIFQDMRVALAIQKRLDSGKSCEDHNFIITSHLGTDLSVLRWSYIATHNVVFVPAPTAKNLAMVSAYAHHHGKNKFEEVFFRVSSQFILPYKPQIQATASSTLSKVEEDILERSHYIDDIDELCRFLERIIDESVSTEAFRKKYVRDGIFMPEGAEIPELSASASSLPPPNPALMVSRAHKSEDVKVNHILKPGNIVVVVGEKNAGKTQFGCLLAKSALRLEKDAWPFCKSVSVPLENVCIVDGETDSDDLKSNFEQHGLDKEKDKRVFLISRFAEDRPEFANDFRLISEEFLNGLRHYLIDHQCRLLILDNLTELMGHGINHDSAAQKVLLWAEKLQEIGICVVFLLHKSDEAADKKRDRSGGSQLYKKRARVVINLYGVREINTLNLGPQIVQDSASKDGLTMGIAFTTCKSAPCLENKTIWLHLPMGATRWKQICLTGIDGEEITLPSECACDSHETIAANEPVSITANMPKSSTSDMNPDGLDHKEKRILDAVRELGGDATVSDIAGYFKGEKGFGEDTIRGILKNFVGKGFMEAYKERNADHFKLIS